MLAGIVEEARILAVGSLDDLLEALALKIGTRQQLVAVVDISLVVLIVVKFECFRRHVGSQRIVGVGQIRKFEGHGHKILFARHRRLS